MTVLNGQWAAARMLLGTGCLCVLLIAAIPLRGVDYTIPTFTYLIDTADINDDGYNDLLLDATGGISYLQNNGDGTFAPYEIIIPGAVELAACCQLDNIAGADIAVFRVQGGNTVTPLQYEFYYNSNFTDPVVIPFVGDFTFHSTYKYAHGDFNGDGLQDLAFAGFTHHPTNQLYWCYMYNLGNHQFSTPVWGQPTYYVVGDIRVADVNGGGCDDIVYIDSSIFVLYSVGTGFIADEIYGNYHYGTIVPADFDLDGDMDLLADSWEGGWNNHHRYYETLGMGSYVLHDQMYQHFWGQMHAAKLNADEYPDLISIYGNGFAVFINQQDWTTAFSDSYDMTSYYDHLYCVVGRFNDDEYDDIAVALNLVQQDNLKIRYCYGDGYFVDSPVANPDEETVPAASLLQCYPNPFQESTTLSYETSKMQQVELCIHNLRGQVIRHLYPDSPGPGYHSIVWDGRDDHGTAVGSGIYLARLRTGNRSVMKKLVRIK